MVVTLAAWAAANAADAPEPEISLRWALGAWGPEGEAPSAIKRDTQLAPGTRLKFLVEPLTPSTVYLILQDSEQAIHVLYRESSTPVSGGEGGPTYVPPGKQYFEVDEASGLDTFFLLASAQPLAALDKLLDRYAAAEEAGRRTIGTEIVAEIRQQHKAHRDFARPVEKPVMIGGQTRSGTTTPAAAIDRLAVEVNAERFYAKTITIDH
jgi:hypothetical protein